MRQKVLILPYFVDDSDVRVICVKNKKHNEWTFISGGKDTHETIFETFKRELKEETLGILDLDRIDSSLNLDISYQEFISTFIDRSERKKWDIKKEDTYSTKYHIFAFNCAPLGVIENFKKDFRQRSKTFQGSVIENKDMDVFTLQELQTKKTWYFIREVILKNFKIIDTLKRIGCIFT